MSARVNALLRVLDDWLFPPQAACLCCRYASGAALREGLCPSCARLLAAQQAQGGAIPAPLAEGVDAAWAAFPYAEQARSLILRLKFDGLRDAAPLLAQAMAALTVDAADVLVPIPTTRARLRSRGFNQAEVLARHVGAAWHMPVRCALTRRDAHAPQVRLSAQARRENLRGCMQADTSVRGLRVLLVDDVYTTGSTVQEAARALRAAGAVRVTALVAANTQDDARETVEALFAPRKREKESNHRA